MLELGRFFAFVKSHRLDSTSSGHGVRQFKTALLQRLKRRIMSVIGEVALAALFEAKATSSDLLKIFQQEQVHVDLNKWKKTLSKINAVLDDAEEKRETSRLGKILLDELEELAYDADDILDEFATEVLRRRGAKSDAREMQRFYQDFYKKYIQDLQNAADKHDRAQLTKAYQTASVLFEVLKAIEMSIEVKLNAFYILLLNDIKLLGLFEKNTFFVREPSCAVTLQAHAKVEEKKQLYKPYNILPLDPDSENQAIMRYPEIQASVSALRNIRGLPWPKDDQKKVNEDILDWLQAMFGFQKDNVENQREHLILLLANVHIRQFPKPNQQPKFDDRALTEVMKKLFKNYKRWCKYLDRKSSLWLPTIQQEVQQRKLLYMGLYLLIWGEASNLRFMPECLCYIYHHMAFELYGMLDGRVSPMTGEPVKPVYGGDDEAFLKKVVTPIYETIAKEAKRRRGKAKHSQWRNYDDLNEYFWSVDCFRLGWPMRADADFFCQPLEKLRADKKFVCCNFRLYVSCLLVF
ncbi:callose synthase 2 [Quercus suber]|uniref:Callose synthase 2 n=1 Tax=Quercus suber TaxID=58331 RepID=A0AAW0KR16_QUESU